MCGITGIFNRKNSFHNIVKALETLKNRGKDGVGIASEIDFYYGKNINNLKKSTKLRKSNNLLGHNLHSVVGYLPQPLISADKSSRFSANCEIYNWNELNKKYKLKAKNDAELLFKLIEKKGIDNIQEILEELDGVYAFAYWKETKLYIARDIVGEKPIWYSHADGFAFASEKKALEKIGCLGISELNPRKIIIYNIKEDKTDFIDRAFFSILPENRYSIEKIKADLKELIIGSIKKRIPKGKFGILFSGGVDSTTIALVCKQLKKNFTCYTAVLDNKEIPEDLIYAKKAAKELSLKLKVIKIKQSDVEKYLKIIVPLIEDSNVVKVGVGLTFFAACEAAKKDKMKVIFSGLGAEELFAGYQRHKSSLDINKECLSGLLKIYERDTYRDDTVTMHNNLELRTPFLDTKLIDFSLKIPQKFKINSGIEKWILRQVALDLGLPDEFANRKKRAAQYGSKFDRAITRLTKKDGLHYKSDYLRKFYPSHNLRLAAMISSGKDSIYATYVMKRQNYEISCLVTIKSENPSSYMFHTPNVDLVKLQAEAMKIPLIEQETKGEKEDELDDLRNALSKAKEQYKIEGVITGAIFSNYQRDRIEKVCDSLGLKIFSPLWHANQETLVREIINNDFRVVLSSVAAEGFDASFLNKKIDENFLNNLIKINKKIGINVAGEGGEYESLVLDCPLFDKKIKILDYDIVEESRNTANMVVKKAELVEK